jgi:hypothetical protein
VAVGLGCEAAAAWAGEAVAGEVAGDVVPAEAEICEDPIMTVKAA